MHAPAAKICDTCGSSLDLETPSGFCPACLLSTALNGSDEEANGAGASIADYEILSEIARGGMGIVYRARQHVPARVVALKMILPAHISSARAIARFRAEAEAAASLDHPGILPIYAVGEKDGAPFYSMKFAEGGSLASRLVAFRDKPRDSADLIAKLARATAHAHERGILHRDLKPGNVLFDGTDKAFVSDFGLAKWLERECDLTQTLAILGTPHYMAPEQTAHSHSLTPAADIYSLGAILFHLLTGRVPFRGENALEVLRQAAERPPPRPRSLNRNVPADLETICLKCLEKKPAARYSSAAALAEDLDRFLAQRPIRARRANPIVHVSRWARRNPSIALLGAASIALLISLLLVLRPPPPQLDLGKSIAVLPFENLSDDPADTYFADGIQDDVLTSLAKVADLKVISHTSVMQYRGRPKNAREIGKALKVAHLLEGSVRTIGGRIHVNAQLIDTRSDKQIWAEQFDRERADVFAIRSELSERIVSHLKANLSPAEKASIEAQPTRDLQAYDLYLRAKEIMFQLPSATFEADISRAIEMLNQAVARDSDFALAYCLLSRAHVDVFWELGRAPAHLERARLCVDAASRLAPDSGETHFARAFYFFHGSEENDRALAEFTIAMRQLPNNAEVFAWSGMLERRLAHWNEAVRDLRKAIDLDPHNPLPPFDLSTTYEMLRQYTEAELVMDRAEIAMPQRTNPFRARKASVALLAGDTKACRAILESLPGDYKQNGFIPYLWARLHLWNRNYVEAGRALDRILPEELTGFTRAWVARDRAFIACAEGDLAKAQPILLEAVEAWKAQLGGKSDEGEARSYLALWFAALGRKEEALIESQKAVDLRPLSRDATNAPSLLNRQALVYAWCGQRDLAFKQLATLSKIPGGPSLGELKLNPAWDSLRDDPRFQELIARPDVVIPVGELEAPPPSEIAKSENNSLEKSIAVLPFENLSEDNSNEYFASGIHDDVLANLSRIGQLKVISRNSILPYKPTARNLRQIGNALGVRTVLEGNIRCAGSRAHINVQLIDATNDAQIWADSFDREMTDLFSVQSDLAVRIAAALQVKLSPAERASIETPLTRDAEAYDFYLRGRELLHGIASLGKREENLSTAIDLLNRAVARDPNFALGYCLLAELHLARLRVSRSENMLLGHDPADLEKVRSNLEIALRIAPDLGEAHLVRGMYFYRALSDYKSASAEFSIARRALPNNAECFHLSGLLERRQGRWSEGLHDQIKAVSLDPQNALNREDLASTYYLNRNFAEAERVLDQAIVAIPEHANFFRLKKAQVGLMKGDLEGARAALQSLPPDYEYDGLVRYYRARLALYLRDFAEADRILVETLEKLGSKKAEWWVVRDRAFVARAEGDRARTEAAFQTALRVETEIRKKMPDDPGVVSMIALFQAGLGRKEEALREMQKAVELRPLAADAVDGPAIASAQTLVYAWCGERDRALEQLAVLAKMPSGPDPGDLKFNPSWDVLRGDPRFEKVVAAASEPIAIP